MQYNFSFNFLFPFQSLHQFYSINLKGPSALEDRALELTIFSALKIQLITRDGCFSGVGYYLVLDMSFSEYDFPSNSWFQISFIGDGSN